MRFSIIIPVYNVEKYIRRCMESIMNQTFRDYEVIVVDDESPDNSMRIVEEFAENFPGMITMIHQKNTRQGGARNRGVREAKGEYILFVDSDDYVSETMLEVVDAKLRETPCDILVFQHMIVTEEGKKIGMGDFGSLLPGTYAPRTNKEVLTLSCEPWKKAYLRSFYLESRFEFPEKILYEDAVTRVLYAKASQIVICSECLYYYVHRAGSSIRQKLSERMLDILKVTDLTVDMLRKDGLYDHFQDVMESALIGGIVYILEVVNESDPLSPMQNAMMDYIADNFPGNAENTYLDVDIRRNWEMLENRKFMQYHYRVIQVRKLKRALLRWSAVEKMNQLRKRFLKKE